MSVDPGDFDQLLGFESAAPQQHGRSPGFVAFLVVDPAIGRTHTDHLPAEPNFGMTNLVEPFFRVRKHFGHLTLGTPVEFAALAVRLGRCQTDTWPNIAGAEHFFVACEVVLRCLSLVDISRPTWRQGRLCVPQQTTWKFCLKRR